MSFAFKTILGEKLQHLKREIKLQTRFYHIMNKNPGERFVSRSLQFVMFVVFPPWIHWRHAAARFSSQFSNFLSLFLLPHFPSCLRRKVLGWVSSGVGRWSEQNWSNTSRTWYWFATLTSTGYVAELASAFQARKQKMFTYCWCWMKNKPSVKVLRIHPENSCGNISPRTTEVHLLEVTLRTTEDKVCSVWCRSSTSWWDVSTWTDQLSLSPLEPGC